MNRPTDLAITLSGLGKSYPLYSRPTDRVLDAFGLLRFFPWRKKTLRSFWALRGVSLHVQKGERLGLIGRNGAGKSTLLKLIGGIVQPTEGQITVNGSIQALMEMGTAFHPEFTGRENIRASLAYQGYSARETAEHEEDIEDFVELGPFMDQPVKTYSAGMYARLAFAVSTAIRPDILIVDEILGAGDAYFARKCADRMKRLTQDSGATLLFVSHDISSVQQMCDRAIWIERGQIVMDGSPLDIGKAYYAETLRLEEERLTRHNQRGSGGSLLEVRPDVSAEKEPPPQEEPIKIQTTEEPISGFRRIKQSTDKFASTYLEICEINICGKNGPQAVFDLHENFSIELKINVKIPTKSAWFCMAVYTIENMVVYGGQWNLGEKIEPASLSYTVTFNHPGLRQGEYILSFSILEDYQSMEPVFLSEWNRTHCIRINENYFGVIGLGVMEISTSPPSNTFLTCNQDHADTEKINV